MNKNFKKATFSALMAVAWANPSYAVDLVSDYQKATSYDPVYQTAIAERSANQAAATQARMSYLPEGSISNQRLQTDTSNRRTITLTQPVLNYERIAAFRQGTPKDGFADATFLAKQQDLATRLLKAANAIILANESIKLNTAKIATLNEQALAAKKKLEYGQGTITDLRDVEAKSAQARAQHLTYKTNLEVAVKQYAAITGTRPNVKDFEIRVRADAKIPLLSVDEYVGLALKNNATLSAARFTEKITELDVSKSTGSMLPALSATHSSSTTDTGTVKYTGILINMPLAPSTYFARASVNANFVKAKEATRDVEEKTKLDIERLHDQVETGFETLKIQRDAIEAAELSLVANQKSFEGGVRTTVDILNAAQNVFQVKSDYVTLATTQAENLLNLTMQTAVDPVEALTSTTRFLGVK